MENLPVNEFEFTARGQLSFLSRILSNNIEFVGKRENDGSLTSEDAMAYYSIKSQVEKSNSDSI